MSEVLELHHFEYCPVTETVHVEADVSDAVPGFFGNRIDPPESYPARCYAKIYWPCDFTPPTEESLSSYLRQHEENWVVIPFDELDSPVPYRNLHNYYA